MHDYTYYSYDHALSIITLILIIYINIPYNIPYLGGMNINNNPSYFEVHRGYQGFDPHSKPSWGGMVEPCIPKTRCQMSSSLKVLSEKLTYPLVIKHGNGKTIIYRWFSHLNTIYRVFFQLPRLITGRYIETTKVVIRDAYMLKHPSPNLVPGWNLIAPML